MEQVSMWAILPAKVRYDKRLPANAKLLYAEIAAKCNRDGVCYMFNQTMGDILGVSADRVARLTKLLEDAGYIVIHIDNTALNSQRRMISLTAEPFIYTPPEPEGGPGKNTEGVPGKNNGAGPGKNTEGAPVKITGPLENNNLKYKPPKSPKGDGVCDEQTGSVPDGVPDAPEKPKREKRTRRERKEPAWKPERFNAFWAFYPPVNGERPAKARAITAWDKLKPDDEVIDAMARYLVIKKKTEQWTRGVGIPYASTFLNGRMWETEQAAPESAPPDDGGEVREEWQ